MKKIELVIHQEKFKELEAALRDIGIGGLTVTEVKGFGTQKAKADEYLFLPKTKLEIYASDGIVDHILDTITRVCDGKNKGECKVAVLPMEDIFGIKNAQGRCDEKETGRNIKE